LYGRQRASSGSIRLVVLRLWGDPATTPLYPLSLHDALPILSVWFGMQAPAGTPAAIIKKVNAGMTDMLKEKDVIERFGKQGVEVDRKSTRLNSSHVKISYAVFCLKQTKGHAARRAEPRRDPH